MAYLVQEPELSLAWLSAMELLIEEGGKVVNLNVSFPCGPGDPGMQALIDEFVDELRRRTGREIWPVQTVANTIFPDALYHPHLGADAAPRLYEAYAAAMRLHRHRKGEKDTYFNRLVAYPSPGGPYNQLAVVVERLRKQSARTGPPSSAYELGISEVADGDLRIQKPDEDRSLYGFPCLSHISLTLVGGRLNMTALYRNQSFIARAYGNYLGLSRLLAFIADQAQTQCGEIEVVATHADAEAELGKRRIAALVAGCRAKASVVARAQ